MRALDMFRAEQDAERNDDARIEALTNDVMFALDAYAVERNQAKQRLRERLLRALQDEEQAYRPQQHAPQPPPLRHPEPPRDPRVNGQYGPYHGGYYDGQN